jgi:hypothetical protein
MNAMPAFIRLSGFFGPVLAVLGCVVVLLSVRAAWIAARSPSEGGSALKSQANAVLFWGTASAVLGFLGQCQGTFLALNQIRAATEVSPEVVAEGFVISFMPTLFGLGIFAFALVMWVSLRVLGIGLPTTINESM